MLSSANIDFSGILIDLILIVFLDLEHFIRYLQALFIV